MSVAPGAGVLPPGPAGLPGAGHLPQMATNALGFVRGLARTYGPAATFSIGRQTAVLLSRPEDVRAVLIEHARLLTSAEFNVVLKPVLGEGLLTTDGAQHQRLRRLVQPAFSRKRVDRYRDTMVAHTERMLAGWPSGATLDITREIPHLTLSIVCDVLFSLQDVAEVDTLGRSFDTATESARQASLVFRILFRPRRGRTGDDSVWRGPLARLPGTPQHNLAAARGTLDDIVDTLIARRRAAGLDTGDVASALLAARDDGAGALDNAEVRDQLMTLLAAGHATTAVAISWALYLLARHPQVAAALREELERVLGGRPPRPDDLDNLPCLDQVWCETLRLYPPAWAIGRLAHAEIPAAGYRLPAGTLLVLSPWVTHRLPDLFPEPGRFLPGRFALRGTLPPHAYFPFGAGGRMCIGAAFAALEAKVVLATILQRHTLAMADEHPVLPRAAVILRPARGIRMVVGG